MDAEFNATLGQLSTRELLDQALVLSIDAIDEEGTKRWEIVVQLHKNSNALVFTQAEAWSQSDKLGARILAADILGQLGVDRGFPFKQQAMPILEKLLTDREPEVIHAALVALSHLGVGHLLPQVINLSTHRVVDVRYGVALALNGLEDKSAVQTMLTLMRDSDCRVRDWATFGIAINPNIDGDEVRNALSERLADSDVNARSEAILGLAVRHDTGIVALLQKILESREVNTAVVQAAYELGANELLTSLEKLKVWWDIDLELLNQAIYRCSTSNEDKAEYE